MKYCVDRLFNFCIRNDLVSEDQEQWFRYGLEKRIVSFFGLIPAVVFATMLTSINEAFWFFIGFYSLRSWINGYHAKTAYGCLMLSFLSEFCFLFLLYPNIKYCASMMLCIVCFCILLRFAPYNHPNMNYSQCEIQALKKVIKHRILLLGTVLLILGIFHYSRAIQGITTGIALATFMLCLAYITEWRTKNEQ